MLVVVKYNSVRDIKMLEKVGIDCDDPDIKYKKSNTSPGRKISPEDSITFNLYSR